MSSVIRSPFVLVKYSIVVLAAALTGACSQAPDTISAVEEAPQKAAIAPAAQAVAAPEKAAACGGPAHEGEDCPCHPGNDGEEAMIGDVVEQITLADAPVRGPADAKVTLVVFSDFECSFCAGFQKTLRALEQEYPGKLRIALKHHPLRIHKQAGEAARAVIAAGAQGKPFELADALYREQSKGDASWIDRSAAAAGLDVERLHRDMSAADVQAKLAADEAESARLKILGTPSVFVNGRRVKGAQPIEVFRQVIDQALAAR